MKKLTLLMLFCISCSASVKKPATDVAASAATVQSTSANNTTKFYNDGRKVWYTNGLSTKEVLTDGTVVIYTSGWLVLPRESIHTDLDGTIKYYKGTSLHRLDGPAVEYTDGTKEWWVDGKLHRENGPAREEKNRFEWYINGVFQESIWYYDCDKTSCLVQGMDKEKTVHLLCALGVLVKDLDNCVFHRTDGPAVQWKNGNKEWFINGKRHKEDGPAIIVEYPSHKEVWFVNGEQHREDGPAVIDINGECWFTHDIIHKCHLKNGSNVFYENGKISYVEKWNGTKVFLDENGNIDYSDGPIFNNDGFKRWWKNGKVYKAQQISTGTIINFDKNGELLNSNGPMEQEDGTQVWINNKIITKMKLSYGTTVWLNKDFSYNKSDGPVMSTSEDGTEIKEWWSNGKVYQREINGIIIKITGDSYSFKDDDGNLVKCNKEQCIITTISGEKVIHYNSGQVKIIDVNGITKWFDVDGNLFRTDTPGHKSIYE